MKPVVICFGAVVEFRQIHDLDGCEQSISFVFPFSPTFPSKIHTFPARFGATYDCGENPRKETERKRITMKNSNELNVPQAREAMDKFKMQAAQDVDGPVTY